MEKTENRRIALWDNLKFLLILLVVIGHFSAKTGKWPFGGIYLFIYSFHMPLFLFISGLFHKNERIGEKVTGFLLIYVLFKFVIYYTCTLCGFSASFQLFTEDGAPWYMLTLACYILVTWLTRNLDKRILLGIAVFLGCVISYDNSVGDFLALTRFFAFYPFYLLGTMLSQKQVFDFFQRKGNAFSAVAVLLLLLWLYLCVFHRSKVFILQHLFTGRHPYEEEIRLFGFLYRLLTYAITAVLSVCVIRLVPARGLPVLTLLGRRTLQIYFWHRPILYVLVRLKLRDVLLASPAGKIVWLLLAVVLTFLLSLRIFSFPTSQIMKLSQRLFSPRDGKGAAG